MSVSLLMKKKKKPNFILWSIKTKKNWCDFQVSIALLFQLQGKKSEIMDIFTKFSSAIVNTSSNSQPMLFCARIMVSIICSVSDSLEPFLLSVRPNLITFSFLKVAYTTHIFWTKWKNWLQKPNHTYTKCSSFCYKSIHITITKKLMM